VRRLAPHAEAHDAAGAAGGEPVDGGAHGEESRLDGERHAGNLAVREIVAPGGKVR